MKINILHLPKKEIVILPILIIWNIQNHMKIKYKFTSVKNNNAVQIIQIFQDFVTIKIKNKYIFPVISFEENYFHLG